MVLMIKDESPLYTWTGVVDALLKGHKLPRAKADDCFLGAPGQTLLSRSAWIPGLGFGAKTVTVFEDNPKQGLPSVQGAMMVFSPHDGVLKAIVDGPLVTKYKTAGDSVLGARFLARPDSKILTIVGTGTVAENLVRAYAEIFPELEEITLWGRTASKAQELVQKLTSDGYAVTSSADLEAAVSKADIVSSATMSRDPIIKGSWVQPGTHVDLIGAFRADMREADDELISKGSLFVDSRDTTVHHIGEIMIPIKAGVIKETDIRGELYDLAEGRSGRSNAQEITVFKNGGGAHLDLITADYLISKYQIS